MHSEFVMRYRKHIACTGYIKVIEGDEPDGPITVEFKAEGPARRRWRLAREFAISVNQAGGQAQEEKRIGQTVVTARIFGAENICAFAVRWIGMREIQRAFVGLHGLARCERNLILLAREIKSLKEAVAIRLEQDETRSRSLTKLARLLAAVESEDACAATNSNDTVS